MNENKNSRFIVPEVWWPNETSAFPQSFQQNSVPSVQRTTAFPPQTQCIAARENFPHEKPCMSKQTLSSSISMNASNPFELHSTTVPSNSGTPRAPLPYSNAPRISPMYNVQQVNPSNLYPSRLKQPVSSNFNFTSVYPSVNQPQNANSNQPTSNVISNVLSNSAQISDLPFNALHCNYNFNGYSTGERVNVTNHVNSVGTVSTQSVAGKVPLQNLPTVQKDNNWQSCPGISPLRIPTEENFHVPQVPTNCRQPFTFKVPQNQISMPPPPMNSVNNLLPVPFPNSTLQCSKPRLPGTTASNPLVAGTKVEEVKTDKSYSSDIYSNQQNLFVNSNALMLPPPSYPSHLYPQSPIPLVIQNASSISCIPDQNFSSSNINSGKEDLLSTFLEKFQIKEKPVEKNNLTVVEFRSALKLGFSLLRILELCKSNFTNLLQSSEDTWMSEMKRVSQMQCQLSEICSMVSSPSNLLLIQEKLKIIKKKREHKKRRKQSLSNAKLKALEERKIVNQEIDKWLDFIKEKNLKLKREIEMKKEADNILSEVRRKIHEAKRTIEKIKVFEKLRSARQANAVKKSLFVLPEHNENFEKKVAILKETMLKQLSDYEAEEKALKVMLETEQEGQLEEEALWRIKKMKTLQQKKQKNIYECLFGDSEEPSPGDPLYLFYKHHDSANSSIENLVQIRHHWDVHLVKDGESIPQQWVSPVPPSDPSWELKKV